MAQSRKQTYGQGVKGGDIPSLMGFNVKMNPGYGEYVEQLKSERFAEQLEGLYDRSFEEASNLPGNLDATKLAEVGFELKDGRRINRLGWTLANVKWILDNPDTLRRVLADGKKIRENNGYVVFCGMGGSGLSVQTVKTTFGEQDTKIYSLRTTDPAVISDILSGISSQAGSLERGLKKTSAIPISKSGATKETVEHKKYFEKLRGLIILLFLGFHLFIS